MSSIFLGDYLKSEGQAAQTDLDLLADGGFVVEGADGDGQATAAPGEHDTTTVARGTGAASGENAVTVRRRGPGTSVAPNA